MHIHHCAETKSNKGAFPIKISFGLVIQQTKHGGWEPILWLMLVTLCKCLQVFLE